MFSIHTGVVRFLALAFVDALSRNRTEIVGPPCGDGTKMQNLASYNHRKLIVTKYNRGKCNRGISDVTVRNFQLVSYYKLVKDLVFDFDVSFYF